MGFNIPPLPTTTSREVTSKSAVAKRYAAEAGKNYNDLNLIVVHMGGGVSVGAHVQGKVVDVFNALDGDGAFLQPCNHVLIISDTAGDNNLVDLTGEHTGHRADILCNLENESSSEQVGVLIAVVHHLFHFAHIVRTKQCVKAANSSISDTM